MVSRSARVVMVSTYPPRLCGLATFTQDLRAALVTSVPGWRVDVAAIDRGDLPYQPEVLVAIDRDDERRYRRAAELIAAVGTDLVVIQHEYGIFGGPDGAHVLALATELRRNRVPYAVTLHTVLSSPTAGQALVLRELCATAAAVTVFTHSARRIIIANGSADPARVTVVPHGAPTVLRERGGEPGPALARAIDLADEAPVLSTFGLLGPGKGLDHVIAALPAIVARHPGVRYVIAGATHPEVLRTHGEAYRDGLVALAERLGVADHVRFVDAFLSEAELSVLLRRTTIYLTPYLGAEQACSGTLAFAVAAGCPVVSTPFRYAREMLAPHGGVAPGVLVPFNDADALADAVNDLLGDPGRLAGARRAANAVGAELAWPSVATRFARTYAEAWAAPPAGPRESFRRRLDHLDRLTGETGIIQFARGSRPDPRSGSCVDDAARIAIVAAELSTMCPRDARPRRWLSVAMRFLDVAIASGAMHNLRGADGRWVDTPHLGDHVGRSIWAAGVVSAAPGVAPADRLRARRELLRLLPMVERLRSVRPVAYAVLGLTQARDLPPRGRMVLRSAARRLHAAIADDVDWPWFAPDLTYDNARLPQALLVAGARLGEPALITAGLSTLDWYLGQVDLTGPTPGPLCCVGNRWRTRDKGTPPDDGDEGDEQPLDAAAVAEALVTAWQLTADPRYRRLAALAFAWFHGLNRASLPLYDAATGGCHDGLSADAVNANQGAESALAYYQALAAVAGAGIVRLTGGPAQDVAHSITVRSSRSPRKSLTSAAVS